MTPTLKLCKSSMLRAGTTRPPCRIWLDSIATARACLVRRHTKERPHLCPYGGDRVHFCLLEVAGQLTEESPVVMIVPCNPDEPRLVVGDTLRDFLALGCTTGYFFLEHLFTTSTRQLAISSTTTPSCDTIIPVESHPRKTLKIWLLSSFACGAVERIWLESMAECSGEVRRPAKKMVVTDEVGIVKPVWSDKVRSWLPALTSAVR